MSNMFNTINDEKIVVIDACMGAGKTSKVLKEINDNPKQKYIYITPLLTEVERVKKECPKLHFKEPRISEKNPSKYRSLLSLMAAGENVVTTHALFEQADEVLINIIKDDQYHLICDETLQIDELLPRVTDTVLKLIFGNHLVTVDPITKKATWNHENELPFIELAKGYSCGRYSATDEEFKMIRRHALNGNLFCLNEGLFYWTFPPNVLQSFESVTVLTYLFKGTPMSVYFEMYNMKYNLLTLDNGRNLVDYTDSYESVFKECFC